MINVTTFNLSKVNSFFFIIIKLRFENMHVVCENNLEQCDNEVKNEALIMFPLQYLYFPYVDCYIEICIFKLLDITKYEISYDCSLFITANS